MNSIFATPALLEQGHPVPRLLPAPRPGRAGLPQATTELVDVPTSAGFIALLTAFRASGGTARAADVTRLLEDHQIDDSRTVEDLVADEEVFGFAWRDTFWIPMLQFDLGDLSIRRGPQQVAAELRPQFDGWQLAAWFARPNGWLDGSKPVDLMASKFAEVVDAARVDRFVAAG